MMALLHPIVSFCRWCGKQMEMMCVDGRRPVRFLYCSKVCRSSYEHREQLFIDGAGI